MSQFTRRFRYNLLQFTRSSKSTGILLIVCTIVSILFTNLPFGKIYRTFWEKDFSFFNLLGLPSNMIEWINDGLMALFFFSAGIEIKRELLEGELRTLKKAILPLFAAIGGVLIPAIIYSLFSRNIDFAHGWGIPTATDIAFSIGLLSMLGRKYVPESLKIFLTALAIIDDLIAILIVCTFLWEYISSNFCCVGVDSKFY